MTYYISDIHGYLNALDNLIQAIARNDPTPSFVFLGDYVDRGPDSVGVLSYLINLRHKYPCTFLRGNHDDMLLADLALPNWCNVWKGYMNYSLKQCHIHFLQSTQLLYVGKRCFATHAWFPNRPVDSIDMTYSRDDFELCIWNRNYTLPRDQWGKIGVFGHSPRIAMPEQSSTHILMDGGIFEEGGTIRAFCEETGKFLAADANGREISVFP